MSMKIGLHLPNDLVSYKISMYLANDDISAVLTFIIVLKVILCNDHL